MNKIINLLAAILLAAAPLFSQNEKGVSPVNPQSVIANPQSTRAVVIGISDYREPLIPDLRFADRDAEAFANWLRSPAGLALPDSNLVFLKNKDATTAQMIVSLDWLIEKSTAGDRAFIYFSGHGDVERVTKFQRGYLLSHDSPPAVYGAGAFSLNYLQDILSTLSEKNVQVFVITDACRAGKLAGTSIGGTQATATQLSQQFANEIKVLSCQPDELSLEGEQWGGGRGCFSYHLEDALYGFADGNADATVDLLELRRYLEDNVGREAAPQNQLPMVAGPVKTTISAVRAGVVAARKAEKGNRATPFRAVDNRGMEDRLLAKTDTSDRRIYAQFLAAVDSGFLMQPAGRSADDYFKMLLERPTMAGLHGSMKRKLAAALMDEGQDIINKVLKTDPQVLDNIWANRVNYDHLPAYFERAAEILGEKHYVWRDLKAKEFYFRAMTVRKENYPDSSADWRDIEKRRWLEKSLTFDSTAAVTHYQLGKTFPHGSLKVTEQYQKAARLAPAWALVHYDLGGSIPDPLQAIYHHKKSMELDSTFLPPYNWIAWKYDKLGQKDSATFWRKVYVQKFFQKFAEDSVSVKAFECNSLGNAQWRLREYESAKAFLLRGEKISGGMMTAVYGNLTVVYTDLLEFENAVHAAEKVAVKGKSWYNTIGKIYFCFLNDPAAAAVAFAKAGDDSDLDQIQFHLSTGNLPKAYAQAKQRTDGGTNKIIFYFYAAEAARQMGLPDTANYFYGQIIEKAPVDFKRNDFEMPNYLFTALAFSRLDKTKELEQLLETANEKLNGDPWLHFNLARFYAQTNQEKAAIAALQKAIDLGWQPNPLLWLHGTFCDPMLDPIRETKDFKKLVKKHFPKYYDIATRIPGKH